MFFDRLCGLMELMISQVSASQSKDAVASIENMARSARLFDIVRSRDAIELEVAKMDSEMERFLHDTFFIPFRTVAINSERSAIIIQDTERDSIGFRAKRRFVTVDSFEEEAGNKIRESFGLDASEDIFLFSSGSIAEASFIQYDGGREALMARFSIGLSLATKNRLLDSFRTGSGGQDDMPNDESEPFDSLPEWKRTLANAVLRKFIDACKVFALINSPNRFVVEVSSSKIDAERNKKPTIKIPRSHERPQYTLLTVKEIKELFGEENHASGSHAAPIPHERRRHFRRLSSDYFKNKKGSIIMIPACWVGECEKIVGTKKYRVVVDA